MSIDRSLGRKFYRDIGLPYRHPVVQFAIDATAIFFTALFVLITGLSIVLSPIMLFFFEF